MIINHTTTLHRTGTVHVVIVDVKKINKKHKNKMQILKINLNKNIFKTFSNFLKFIKNFFLSKH